MKEKIKKIIKSNKLLYQLILPIVKLKHKRRIRVQNYFDKIFSNVLEGEHTVTLNNIPGKFEIDARSHILKTILVFNEYEPDIVKHILENTSSSKDAINVGANIGVYTNLLATRINENLKVLAVEPTPNAFKHLKNY
jgi:hypothetical protein